MNIDDRDFFEVIKKAYQRGVDWAAEFQNWDSEEYEDVWKHVPKASYDYADKTVSYLAPPKPNKTT